MVWDNRESLIPSLPSSILISDGVCLFTRRYHQAARSKKFLLGQQKLMWGLLYSLKDFVNQLAPKSNSSSSSSSASAASSSTSATTALSDDLDQSSPFYSFMTSDYKVHYLETPNGFRFVLVTDSQQLNKTVQDTLLLTYKLYVEYAVKNPLYTIGETLNGVTVFVGKVETLLEGVSYFH